MQSSSARIKRVTGSQVLDEFDRARKKPINCAPLLRASQHNAAIILPGICWVAEGVRLGPVRAALKELADEMEPQLTASPGEGP